MSVLVFWLRLVLLSVFARALWTHLVSPGRLQRAVAEMGVPGAVPLAAAVTVGDAVVCGLLLAAPTLGAVAALSYMTIVTTVVLLARFTGRAPRDCGCGPQPKPADSQLAARNALLGIGALVVAVATEPTFPDLPSLLATTAFALHEYVQGAIPRLAARARFDATTSSASVSGLSALTAVARDARPEHASTAGART